MQDEKEVTGLRKILNLGHTYAHAFESESNYKLKHGEAVIGGVFSALFLSEKIGFITNKKLVKIIDDFQFLKLNKILHKLDSEKVYNSMIGDKKNLSGKIKLVLLEDIGSVIVDVVADRSVIIESIKDLQNLGT